MSPEPSGPAVVNGGVFVLTGFGVAWALTGLTGLRGGVALGVGGVVTGVTVGALLLAARRGGARGPSRRGSIPPEGWRARFDRIGLVQAVAIAAVIAVAAAAGLPEAIPVGVCLVVGLHFFPLAGVFGLALYRWTGLGLLAAAGLGLALLLAQDVDRARAVTGFAAAAVLWATAALLLRRGAATDR